MNGLWKRITSSWKLLAVIAAIAFAAAACSPNAGGSAGVPTFGKGVITAKGSVFVNGIEYDTSSTAITINGGVGSDADLKVGMVVEVKGSADAATGKGTALQVLYSADLDGPVGTIDLAKTSFTVFNRTVVTDASTIWEGVTGIAGLVVGDRVEVSGSVDTSTKTLKADRVHKKAASAEDYEVKGIVSALSASSFTLTPPDGASPLTVNFTGTLAASIVNGSSVELRFASTGISGSVITTSADKIKAESHLSADDKSNGEVSGRVSDFAAGSTDATFTVEGVAVSASNSILPAGVANGVKVEVKGSMSGAVLVASSVKTEKESNAELQGNVSSVSAAVGTIVVNGVTVTVDATTRFRDENGAAPVAHFGIASIAVGDYLEVSGLYDAASAPSFVAAKVERKAPESTALVKGPVSAIVASPLSLTVLGVSVIPPAGFASAGITPGTTIVEAKGSFAAGTFTASAVFIDN